MEVSMVRDWAKGGGRRKSLLIIPIDMLNQNYTYVGSKRNCRIALGMFDIPFLFFLLFSLIYLNFPGSSIRPLIYYRIGPYSNPMCHVADGFRCIVLVDSNKVDYTDPPFLNRFEKQSFKYPQKKETTKNSPL